MKITDDRDPALNPHAYHFLTKNFGPYQPTDCKFPKVNGRIFRVEWYSLYNWLEYSVIKDSAYCFYCRCFPPTNKNAESSFTLIGFKSWQRANKSFSNHQNSSSHKESCVKLAGFYSSKKVGTIATVLDTKYKQSVKQNREYITILLENLLFCCRQGIPIRGHNESIVSSNKGNFIELLHHVAKYNNVLKEYFIEKEHNYTYTSASYINNFINIMSNHILKNITVDIKNAKIFSILVDETQDLSCYEQVSIVIRYVDDKFEIHEVFYGFYKTDRTDSTTLANLIKEILLKNNLKVENIRGQCYDGAAAMRGTYNGVQAKIRELNPLAFYVHCYAHILNLCLVDLTKQVACVRNIFGTLQSLYNFIKASSKRNAIYESIWSKSSEANGTKSLKKLCETRWSCRTDALKSVYLNFSEIIDTLEHIYNHDTVSGAEAKSLLNNLLNFEFIFCLSFLKNIFEQTHILSKYLQSPNVNFSTANNMCQSTIDILKNLRSDIEFESKWNEVIEILDEYQIEHPKIKRKKNIPLKLGGGETHPYSNQVKDNYRITIYYKVLDVIIQEMKNRFQENQMDVLNGLSEIIISENPPKDVLKTVSDTYNFDIDDLKTELGIFNRMFKQKYSNTSVSDKLEAKIEYIKQNSIQKGFTLITNCLKIFLTIPTNTASCERSFSCLKRLKTYLRTTMGQERLSNLAILQLEKKYTINIDQVIDEFDAESCQRGRRLNLK